MSPCVGTLEEFDAAIDSFPGAETLALGWSADAADMAKRSLDRHRLLLVGEIHGVAENPLVIEQLVNELEIDVVALEWPRGLERAITDLKLLGTEPPKLGRPISETSDAAFAAAVVWFGDGRVTTGHFAVLRRTSAEAVAVDWATGPPAPDARDIAMAESVERVLASGARVLFIAGNLHTRLDRHEHYAPAGMHLARDRPELCSLEIHYQQGCCWNCGPFTLSRREPPDGPHLLVPQGSEAIVLALGPRSLDE